ncbi:hypothetical protein [Pantoea sp. 1.19]|uniref:hypothetical protein n=1 Tax=Pantoea sp. 1.19 TaxID=1925589 RepID=UPI000948E3CE|nr:hypothetical protein [Pantoea sp. 1.19]
MFPEKSEDAMTFGELLALIRDQQHRLQVLENAFSYLTFCLDDKAGQLLVHNLKLEAQNQQRDAQTQQHFAALAQDIEQRLGGRRAPDDVPPLN